MRDAAEAEELAGDAHEEVLLRADAADVSGDIAGAETHDADGLLTGEVLHAGVEVYDQSLRGIGVVHIHRHVVIDAADGVYELDEGFQIDRSVHVRREAEELGDALERAVNAVAAVIYAAQVQLVYLLRAARYVHERVTRDADDVYLMLFRIQAADHDGVGVVGDLVEADDEEGIHILIEVSRCTRIRVLCRLRRSSRAGLRRGIRDLHIRAHKAAAAALWRLLPECINYDAKRHDRDYRAEHRTYDHALGAALLSRRCVVLTLHLSGRVDVLILRHLRGGSVFRPVGRLAIARRGMASVAISVKFQFYDTFLRAPPSYGREYL